MKFYLLEDNESVQRKLNFFKRNILLLEHNLMEILEEWADHYDICVFDDVDDFTENIVNDSAITLMNNFDEFYNDNNGILDKTVMYYIETYIRDRFAKYIMKLWKERDC